MNRLALPLFLIFIVLTADFALAALLEIKVNPDKIKEKMIEKVKISSSATWSNANKKIDLKTVSSGLRRKKVAFLNVSVYVAEWFIQDTKIWAQSIDDLKSLAPVAMRLTFVRNVESDKIEGAFRESLRSNKIKIEDPPIKEFLAAIIAGGEIKPQETLTFLGHFNDDGSETLFYESNSNKVTEIRGPSGFLKKIFSLWFGETEDPNLIELKKALLSS